MIYQRNTINTINNRRYKMKRTSLFIVTILSFILIASVSNAQSNTNPQPGSGVNWVDANGDGICDNFGTENQGINRTGKGYGKKDGTGNPARPQDGTGFGKKAGNTVSSGVCDGTGPKGAIKRGGRK